MFIRDSSMRAYQFYFFFCFLFFTSKFNIWREWGRPRQQMPCFGTREIYTQASPTGNTFQVNRATSGLKIRCPHRESNLARQAATICSFLRYRTSYWCSMKDNEKNIQKKLILYSVSP